MTPSHGQITILARLSESVAFMPLVSSCAVSTRKIDIPMGRIAIANLTRSGVRPARNFAINLQ